MTPCLFPLHAIFRQITTLPNSWRPQCFAWVLLIAIWQISGAVAADDTASLPVAESSTQTSEVVIPLLLDYPLLQRLLVSQLFTGDGHSRELLNDPSGCSELLLSDPELAPRDSRLELLADLGARIGVGAPGACATLLTWQGRIRVTGRPETRNNGTALGFAPDRVQLLDRADQPVDNDRLQQMADSSMITLFDRFVVDLAPHLQSVAAMLPEVLPRHSRQQIDALLKTLKLSELRVTDEALAADIVFDVEKPSKPLTPERALTGEELALWEERWQLMDSLLVLAVTHYAAETEQQALRDALLEVLIESRYRLRDALVETPGSGEDPVRDWFLQSWQALTPVIRRIGLEQPGQEHLLLFDLIAASDALAALDQLGPSIGLDISADGLRRLARMINEGAGEELLQYSNDVDPKLRLLLEESFKAAPPESALRLNFSLFPQAVAADAGRLNNWAPQREELREYLPEVAALMQTSASEVLRSRSLQPEYTELFRRLVLATAWQESCWRHYVIDDDRKLVPLRSASGDVGLMQVNERVWRGFYSQQKLRWDITYNSAAGAEVLLDYLVKYAIRKGEHRQPGGLNNLARASYSAYNGGPSQVSRYRNDSASAYGKKVDAAFWDKYRQVAAGNELAVSRCLGGDLSGPASASGSSTRHEKTSGPRGVAASSAEQFTLQLGVFSTIENAQAFINQNDLAGKARVQRRRKGDTNQYLVLYGSYATRAQAEKAKQGLASLQPWIRRVGDL
jgi:hypothetical protein